MNASALLGAVILAVFVANSNPSQVRGAMIYGVAVEGGSQLLVTWDSTAPSVLLSSTPITGLPAGETIRGIDFDPSYFPGHQRLFAIGAGSDDFANVYMANRISAFVGKLPTSPSPPADAFGESYGVDITRSTTIRSVDDSSHLAAYSTSANTGGGDGTVVYAAGDINAGKTPHFVHMADNFLIDSTLDFLGAIPNFGDPRPVSSIGSLGTDFDDAGGMDADVSTGTVFAALQPAGQVQSNFYAIALQTGAATSIGPIGGGLLITAMAVEPPLTPVPEPHSAILFSVGLGGSLVCLRRSLTKIQAIADVRLCVRVG